MQRSHLAQDIPEFDRHPVGDGQSDAAHRGELGGPAFDLLHLAADVLQVVGRFLTDVHRQSRVGCLDRRIRGEHLEVQEATRPRPRALDPDGQVRRDLSRRQGEVHAGRRSRRGGCGDELRGPHDRHGPDRKPDRIAVDRIHRPDRGGADGVVLGIRDEVDGDSRVRVIGRDGQIDPPGRVRRGEAHAVRDELDRHRVPAVDRLGDDELVADDAYVRLFAEPDDDAERRLGHDCVRARQAGERRARDVAIVGRGGRTHARRRPRRHPPRPSLRPRPRRCRLLHRPRPSLRRRRLPHRPRPPWCLLPRPRLRPAPARARRAARTRRAARGRPASPAARWSSGTRTGMGERARDRVTDPAQGARDDDPGGRRLRRDRLGARLLRDDEQPDADHSASDDRR